MPGVRYDYINEYIFQKCLKNQSWMAGWYSKLTTKKLYPVKYCCYYIFCGNYKKKRIIADFWHLTKHLIIKKWLMVTCIQFQRLLSNGKKINIAHIIQNSMLIGALLNWSTYILLDASRGMLKLILKLS